MKKVISTVVALLMGCLLLVRCSKAENLEKYYSIEISNDGWSLEECVIGVQDGKLVFKNGHLSINGNYELFEIEIYQENKAGNKDTLFVESCSTVEGANFNKDFKDIEIKKESIDVNSELKAEIKVNNGKKGDEEVIYTLEVTEIEAVD